MKNRTFEHNVSAHNNIAHVYDCKHPEIYNDIEQKRLEEVINKTINYFAKEDIKVLDFGSGTGNVALKYLAKGCKVTATDISDKLLNELKLKAGKNENLKTILLNKDDLSLDEEKYDIISIYSVLHHLPDYIFTLNELMKYLKPGGLLYIDHEANQNKWGPDINLEEYYKKSKYSFSELVFRKIKTKELFLISFYKSLFIRIFINKRHKREGDLHVWKDDHIEWNLISDCAKKNRFVIFYKEDYLSYSPKVPVQDYLLFKDKCNDMCSIIFVKDTNR